MTINHIVLFTDQVKIWHIVVQQKQLKSSGQFKGGGGGGGGGGVTHRLYVHTRVFTTVIVIKILMTALTTEYANTELSASIRIYIACVYLANS